MPNEKSLAGEPSLTESIQRGMVTTSDGGDSTQSTTFTIRQHVATGPLLDERYQLGEEIARGGMGAVHRAVDVVFKREVAVKLLLPKWNKETEPQRQAQRKAQILEAFRYEAEITARLQHPGIPPVHELGHLSDGLPFLAMKLIQGKTLQELLGSRESLHAELPRWLQIFEQVSQAVGYAHSQDILHRDLKPANVMVGAFGEVQVMDWGLAKVVGAAERETIADDDEEEAVPSSRQFVSRHGDIKGTLAYMPPEQARGEIDQLDSRADVFSLGAILCEILTGSPPYSGKNLIELKTQAAAANLTAVFTQLRASGADADLSALAICCLSPNVADRPLDATAVAQAIAEHRASVEQRLRRAETERALSEQRLIEQSRRRKLWYVIAAALLLVVVISSTLAIVYARSNSIIADRETKATNAANLATQREGEAKTAAALAEKRSQEAQEASAKATAQEKIAQDKAALSLAVNNFLQYDLLGLAGAEEQLMVGLQPDPDLKVRDLVLRGAKRIEGKFADQPVVEAETRTTLALALSRLGEHAAAAIHYQRIRELYTQLYGVEDSRTIDACYNLARALREAGRFPESIELQSQVIEQQKKLGSDDWKRLFAAQNELALTLRAAGELDRAVKLFEQTLEQQTEKLGPDHRDTLATKHNLALALRAAGKLDQALPMLEETTQQLSRIYGPEHPDTLGVQGNLALALRAAGQTERAHQLYQQTYLSRRKTLGADHPETISALSNVGVAHMQMDRPDRARPVLEEVLRLRQAKLGPDNLQTLEAMNNLANALEALGESKRALALAEPAWKLRGEKLGPEHPQTLQSQSNLGGIYTSLGDLTRAVSLLEEAVRLQSEKLGPAHDNTLKSKRNLAVAYLLQKKHAKAVPLLEELLHHDETKLGPKHPHTLTTMYNLGTAYQESSEFEQAAKIRTAALKLSRENFGSQNIRTISSMLGLATTEISLKNFDSAEEYLKQVWDDSQKLPKQAEDSVRAAAALEFIKLYEAWDKFEDLARWRDELKKYQP